MIEIFIPFMSGPIFWGGILLVVVIVGVSIFLGMKKKNPSESVTRGGKAEEHHQPVTSGAEVDIAITMALHLYFGEIHDKESNVITIKNASKQYSPWSSKIYSVYNQPRRELRSF